MEGRHVVLVTFPAQGHINPALQFANRLINMGIQVTFATSIHAQRRMAKATGSTTYSPPEGLTFTSFSDGYDDGFKISTDNAGKYMTEIRDKGSKALHDIIASASRQGRPVTSLVYTLLLPWASEVAREHHIPSALLWIQPVAVLAIYYFYYNGYGDEITANSDKPEWEIQLPGIPFALSKHDLPSFLLPAASNSTYGFVITSFKEQLDALDVETNPKVLVNTFDALEPDALRAIKHKYDLVGIGPLIPSDPTKNSFGGDLFRKSDDAIEWLDSKPDSSVVYVAFGSLLNLQKAQVEEIARGLLDSGRPFLWVMRERTCNEKDDNNDDDDQKLSCLEEIEKIGKIVGWCSQLEVLTHRAVGCFMTHCGWNSTLESLSCGVPVVAFPHWTDQGTNAKLIEGVWGSGVRVRGNEEDGMVESGEIKRCVEEVMNGGEKSKEVRENAEKWKGLAREAMGENGSSYKNLKDFLEDVGA